MDKVKILADELYNQKVIDGWRNVSMEDCLKIAKMEKELNYLSEKIEKVEQRITAHEKMPNLKDSLGLQHVLKCRKEELELLNNILNKLTEIALTQ